MRCHRETDDIAANSVVVTRVLNSSGVYGYSISSQDENNVVTNPAPGTQSESIIAAFRTCSSTSTSPRRWTWR